MVLTAIAILMLAPVSLAESIVSLDDVIILDEGDLGIEGYSVSPDGKTVVAHGEGARIFLIDSKNPENNSQADWAGEYSLLDSSFHPGGKTALIVGEGGNVLRIKMTNSSVENAAGSSTFGDTVLM